MRRTNSSKTVSSDVSPSTTADTINKSDYVNYLMSYEGMIRYQDLEFDATSGHMKCVFERIQALGCKKNSDGETGIFSRGDDTPRGMLSYLQIRRCLLRMGVGWNRSSCDSEYDDDVSVLSFNSTSSLHSGLSVGGFGRSDIIATDSQLIMLLTTLVEMEEIYRASKIMSEEGVSNRKNAKYQLDKGLFLPEFIQAYKLVIGGMQSLKSIPNPDHKSIPNPDNPAESNLCNRLKERTLGMLRPFGPNCKMYTLVGGSTSNQSDDALSSNKNSIRSNVKDKNSGLDKKRTRQGFSNPDMKKLMRSKDVTLAKIMEEHESEMDALASSMEELRLKEQRTRIALRKRRKRARLLAILLGGSLIAVGITVESRRRDFLANEIALGREAERLTDAETIAQLNNEKREMEKRLGVIEGKMRYQVNRNNNIDAQTRDIEKQIDDVDMKWWIDKAEIERCFVSQVELSDDLKREQLKKEEVDEESIWCRSRLRSQELELNELGHIRMGGGSEKGLIARSTTGDNATNNGQHKPVYLEMKYNKSIRNAMLLRQTYSAVAGLAVSVFLQGLIPTVIKIFVPKAVIVPLLPMLPKRAEMIVVDSIFGSSVAFLLFRALATFLMPL
mmetsp:Transcript_20166/g.43809  ORF Transcript_20166/g.43809 Transcript_20166/m.43809 type:complete len:614 (-) Transcript_20166:38-1879(-)